MARTVRIAGPQGHRTTGTVDFVKAEDLRNELDLATQIEITQPSDALIAKLERRPKLGDEGVRDLMDYSKEEFPFRTNGVVVLDGLPFYPYYALREGGEFVVHPMALGRFLLRNARGSLAAEIVKASLGIAETLPNGGVAWYYPRNYKVMRMLGRNLKYSSISQGTILAGMTAMVEAGVVDSRVAEGVFDAMLWPFEKSGINLAGRAVLEMPSFAGAPEIILNGWIDALIHIRNYGESCENQRAIDLFKTNVSFLVEILPGFDVRAVTISRYSNLSPYRVKVRLARPADIDGLQVLYRPRIEGLPAIKVPLRLKGQDEEVSVYENHIERQNGREASVWISCSQMYDTILVAESSEMSIELRLGEYDRKASTPGTQGVVLKRSSEQSGGLRFVKLGVEDGLIGGFPTNFSKTGDLNYYHAYHVVGLMMLGMSPEISTDDRRALLEWALRWKGDMEEIEKTESLHFRSLAEMVGDINANQSKTNYRNFDALLADVNEFVAK